MLTKLATFSGTSVSGEPLAQVFHAGDPIQKIAGEMMPEIQEWLRAYKPDKDHIAVLVNAMGAAEYWGQNSNGDRFGWSPLSHDCSNHLGHEHPIDPFTGKRIPVYGYKTFLDAFPFMHHRNKDPSRAFGEVVLSALNLRMRRVELIVIIDRAKALEFGAQNIVDRIDAGDYPDVSMGCRVPYDVCTICGNKSKTRNDYCQCITKIGMGVILPDGRQVGVWNPHPRFFDISFVFIGADKTAKTMMKLGSGLIVPASVIEGEILYGIDRNDEDLVKSASACSMRCGQCEMRHVCDKFNAMTKNAGLSHVVRNYMKKPNSHEKRITTVFTESVSHETGKPVKHHRTAAISKGGKGVAVLEKLTGRKPARHVVKIGSDEAGRVPTQEEEKDIRAFIAQTPNLDDAKFHAFLEAKGINPHEGEEVVYKILHGIDRGQIEPQQKEAGFLQSVTPLLDDAILMTMRVRKQGEKKAPKLEVPEAPKVEPPPPGTEPTKPTTQIINRLGQEYQERLGSEKTAVNIHMTKALAEHYSKKRWTLKPKLEPKKKTASVEIGPPPTPNRAEHPFVGTIKFRGLTIHVENRAGDVREGTGPNGKAWRTEMKFPYGEIVGTKGVDRDKLDAYVGPNSDAEDVYIVHQNFPGDHPSKAGQYDEDKVMLGFDSPEAAEKAYRAHYNRDDFFRSITIMPFDRFKEVIMGEVKGEKVAMELEDFFLNDKAYTRRERTWRNKVTGEETSFIGSGLGDSPTKMYKTAAAKPVKPKRKYASLEALKYAALKMADKGKWAEILKEIDPEGNIGRVTAALSDHSPDIKPEVLNEMGKHDLESALATPSAMGIMLRPHEFQRVMLSKVGRPDLADELDAHHTSFSPVEKEEAPCASLSPGHFDSGILEKLLPALEGRSFHGPVVQRRIIRITIVPRQADELAKESSGPLLDKIAAAYNWYRKEALKIACSSDGILSSHVKLAAAILGISNEDLLTKRAAEMKGSTLAALAGVPLVLMYGAEGREKALQGQPVGAIQRLAANHPILASLGTAAGIKKGIEALQ